MEKRIPVTNNTKMPLYVGSYIVPPGETRDFPESQVPPHLRPQAAAEAAPAAPEGNPLLDLLDKPVNEIIPLLAALTDEELAALEAAETAGKTRKTLLAAIAVELLERAATGGKSPEEIEIDQFVTDLAAMEEAELIAQLETFANDEGRLALVQTELDKRKAGANG